MKVIVGAPVAERAWILPHWWECIEQQVLRPDGFCFVYSKSADNTKALLSRPRMPLSVVEETNLPYFSRNERSSDSKDPNRAVHMAKLRNKLLGLFLQTDGDIFVSLDTDILLEDKFVLSELIDTIQKQDCDLASPVVYLHPLGKQSMCFNAGMFWNKDYSDFHQGWRRIDENDWAVCSRRPFINVDIPMAAIAMRRHVASMCRYKSHESGEDIGFAQSVAKHGFKAGWRTDLTGHHVWGPSYLTEAADAAA